MENTTVNIPNADSLRRYGRIARKVFTIVNVGGTNVRVQGQKLDFLKTIKDIPADAAVKATFEDGQDIYLGR